MKYQAPPSPAQTVFHPCPNCGEDHDLANRLTGDRILCFKCGYWLEVRWGTPQLLRRTNERAYRRTRKH